MAEVVTVDEWQKPLPQVDEVNREFWSSAARGNLLIQECPHCHHRQFYPRALCTKCGDNPGWLECSGRGAVHTFTIVRQMGMRPFRDELPYVVAMVQLDEGPMMMGNVTGIDPEQVRIGMPVEVYFVAAAEDVGIPMWRPTA
jgi:uncharacterized OB-fold protein